jgi:glucose-1-phosphate thymidylyltransferase
VVYYVINVLKKFKVREITFVISPWMEEYIKELKGSINFKIKYVIQKQALGLGDAILQAEKVIKKGKCFIVLGDSILKVKNYNLNFKKNYIGVLEYKGDPRRFGVVEIKDGKIVSVEEKPENPKSNLIICGIYYLSKIEEVFKELKKLKKIGKTTKGEYQLTDAFYHMLDKGQEFYPLGIKEWYDTGTLEDILKTHTLFLDLKKYNKISNKSGIKNSKIIEPIWIDRDVYIENSIVGPYVSLEKGCMIENSRIENSIIYRDSNIRRSKIKKGIIGDNCKINNLNLTSYSKIGG